MAISIGIILMFAGIGLVFSGRFFRVQREFVERCGIYVFLAGLGIWAIALAIFTFAG